MRHPDDKAIGGYFGLEPASAAAPAPLDESAVRYQSARSAMADVIRSSRARRVWLPYFICGAVVDAMRWTGVDILRYALTADHGVPDTVPIETDDWLVCVDYFGLSAAACDDAILRFGADRVLVDASQALFHAARPEASTVYSPRKFAGLPDGGLLVTPRPMAPLPPPDEQASSNRGLHLLSRAGGDVTTGYQQFQEAEASLSDCSPRAMSITTGLCLDNIDWALVRERRIANYRLLAEALAADGVDAPALGPGAVPLCCPVAIADAATLRGKLASEGIFTAMYWPDAEPPDTDGVARELRDGTLYLPCDQRYGREDMLQIARKLARHGGSS